MEANRLLSLFLLIASLQPILLYLFILHLASKITFAMIVAHRVNGVISHQYKEKYLQPTAYFLWG